MRLRLRDRGTGSMGRLRARAMEAVMGVQEGMGDVEDKLGVRMRGKRSGEEDGGGSNVMVDVEALLVGSMR